MHGWHLETISRTVLLDVIFPCRGNITLTHCNRSPKKPVVSLKYLRIILIFCLPSRMPAFDIKKGSVIQFEDFAKKSKAKDNAKWHIHERPQF